MSVCVYDMQVRMYTSPPYLSIHHCLRLAPEGPPQPEGRQTEEVERLGNTILPWEHSLLVPGGEGRGGERRRGKGSGEEERRGVRNGRNEGVVVGILGTACTKLYVHTVHRML